MSLWLSMFKYLLIYGAFIGSVLLISGCQERKELLKLEDKIELSGHFVPFKSLPSWESDDHALALSMFVQECRSNKVPQGLRPLCLTAANSSDAKTFFETYFRPFQLQGSGDEEVLLTGYYEPEFRAALKPDERYKYPLYRRPKGLLVIDMSTLYPELKKYRLRGRKEGRKVVPYYSRKEINTGAIKERPLCYMESDVDRFFLQVQGSGRLLLKNDETLFVGYDGQNGHPYRSIGKALVASGAIAQEKISLQSIRVWLQEHPQQAKDVLESNPSFVFFEKRKHAASGALGMELTAMRSVAVDRSKIPLGYPLFIEAENPVDHTPIERMVFAQDTGGAIKGQVRADLFCGSGKEAEALAGALNAPLRLYILVPNRLSGD